jgi:transposase-like protein
MGTNIFKDKRFSDEAAARAWFEAARWPNGPVCPRCGSKGHFKTKIEGRYRCKAKGCRKDFTVMVGTVMERSHAKLTQWAVAFHRQLGCQYNTAWFLHHRVMEAMRQGGLDLPPMGGEGQIVEADETYFGKMEEPHKIKTSGRPYKGKTANKRAIVSLVERGGKVRSFHIPRADKATVAKIVTDNIHHESRLHTDESNLYFGAARQSKTSRPLLGGRRKLGRSGKTSSSASIRLVSSARRGMIITNRCTGKSPSRVSHSSRYRIVAIGAMM